MRFAATLLLCSILKICCGQSVSFVHLSVPEGLPSSEAYDVFQDRKGFMWFATDNGVVRYDGYEMETFQVNDGLTDPVVFGFVEDPKDRIWFRTLSGRISYYFNKTIFPYRYNDSLANFCKNSILFSLDIDSADNIWFATGNTIGKIDSNGSIQKENIKLDHLNLIKTQNTIVAGHSNQTIKTHSVVVNNRQFPIRLTDQTNNHPIVCTLIWKGKDYFSLGSSIFRINQNSVEQVHHAKGQIISLTLDRDDQLWIGYLLQGTEYLQDFGKPGFNHFPFLNKKSITKVFQDNKGGYWISTLQDGIYYVSEFSLSIKNIPYKTKIRATNAQGDEVVIGDDSGNILVLDENGNVKKSKLLDNASVISILSTTKGDLWASTWNATYVLNHSLDTKVKIPYSFSNFFEDTQRGSIWGISGPTIVQFDLTGEKKSEKRFNKNYRNIFISENIYLYGRLGLDVFTKKFDPVKVPSFAQLKISKILSLTDSTLLIATIGNGFYAVNTFNWSSEHYSSNNKFTADNIYSAQVVDSVLWFGTEKGIIATPISSLLKKSPVYFFYTIKDGLFSNRIDHLIYAKSNIWAFYENGFCLLPSTLTNGQDLPAFYMKDIFINNEVRSLKGSHSLTFDQNNIEIDFGFVDFKTQNIFIRSRLSEKHSWDYSINRNIKYFSLSPDDYFFQLEYSVDQSQWIPALAWNFKIHPQWWRDYRFQIALVTVLLLLISIYFKRRLFLLKEKQNFLKIINENQQKLIVAEMDAREGERSRIARDLHDSVGTSLAVAKMALYKLFKNNDPNVTTIEEQLQGTMQEVKNIVNELSPPGLERYGITKVVNNYAQNIMERFEIKIEVNAFGADITDQKININSFRIIQELLSNSLKHAQAKNITIHINSFDDSLNLLY